MDYQRDEHRVHLIIYHLVWHPKRRKKVLVDDVGRDCRTIIEGKCAEQGWEILELAMRPDHIHLFVRAWPTTSALEIVKACTRLTSHELRNRYPELRKLPAVWPRSYFASTAGNVSAQTIARHVAAQRGA